METRYRHRESGILVQAIQAREVLALGQRFVWAPNWLIEAYNANELGFITRLEGRRVVMNPGGSNQLEIGEENYIVHASEGYDVVERDRFERTYERVGASASEPDTQSLKVISVQEILATNGNFATLPEWVRDGFVYTGSPRDGRRALIYYPGEIGVIKGSGKLTATRRDDSAFDGKEYFIVVKAKAPEITTINDAVGVEFSPVAIAPFGVRYPVITHVGKPNGENSPVVREYATPYLAVIDVESVGVHGEGFAVAVVVGDIHGKVHHEFALHCLHQLAFGEERDHDWVAENVTTPATSRFCSNPRAVRDTFWAEYHRLLHLGCEFWADVNYPVETNFFEMCVDDDRERRAGLAPYPLLDVASALRGRLLPPIGTYKRRENELPAHNPLHDARQSYRVLVELLNDQIPELA